MVVPFVRLSHFQKAFQEPLRAVTARAPVSVQSLPGPLADEALTQLHDGGGAALIEWLQPQLASRRGRPREAIHQLLSYVTDKQHHMNYPAAKARGWQIGTVLNESGMIESTCKPP